MIHTQDEIQSILKRAPADVKPIVEAILLSSRLDEVKIIDDLLSDVQNRRTQLFDILYIDLSIDRSVAPLEVSGGGTLISCIESTDNLANISVSIGGQESDANRRFSILKGKTVKLPYSRFYIYHSAQSGKYLKLLRATSLPSIGLGVEDYSTTSASLLDLLTAIGNSATYATAQVTIPATASGIVIKAANASRKRITITNAGSATVFISKAAPADTTSGHALLAGMAITLNTEEAVYGIVAAGTNLVTYLEE